MQSLNLYGYTGSDLAEIAKVIENLLKITFELSHSYYRGGDYYIYKFKDVGSIVLQSNFNKIEEEWSESEFVDFHTLLYINGTTELIDQIKNIFTKFIPNLKFLKSNHV